MLYRRGWMALAACVLLAITAYLGGHAINVPVRYSLDSLFLSKDQKLEDYERFVKDFGSDDNVLLVMYEADDVLGESSLRALAETGRRLERVPGVVNQANLVEVVHLLDQLRRGALFTGFSKEIRDLPGLLRRASQLRQGLLDEGSCFEGTLLSSDARATLIYLQISAEARSDSKLRAALLAGARGIFADVAARYGGRFSLAGIPVIEAQYEVQVLNDQRIFLPAGVLLFVVLLALYFRRLLGVLLPMICIVAAISWTIGILTLTGGSLNIVTGSLPVLLMVIGVTDAIHVMATYYRRLSDGDAPILALRETFREMRVACFITSFTTAVGFLSLVLVNVEVLQRFGLYAALGLMLCYLLTMGGIWIGLVLTGRERQSGPPAELPAPDPVDAPPGPVGLLPGFGLALGILAFSFFGWVIFKQLRPESRWFQDFDRSASIYRDAMRIQEKVTGVFALEIVLEGDSGEWLRPERLQALAAASRDLERLVEVTSVHSLADLLAEANYWTVGKREIPRNARQIRAMIDTVKRRGGGRMLKRLYYQDKIHLTVRMRDIGSRRFQPLARQIRSDLARHGIKPRGSHKVIYTGKSVLAGRAMDEVVRNMVSSLGFALIFISLTMVVLFRSIKIGLLSMVPNVFPIVVTLGMMPLIGVDLNFSTMFVFSIALGIAVDDTIHVLARYQYEQQFGLDGVIQRTLRSVGKVIVATTFFLMAGVSVLYLSDFRFLHNFALLMQVTLVAALVGDLVILPALLALVNLPCPDSK